MAYFLQLHLRIFNSGTHTFKKMEHQVRQETFYKPKLNYVQNLLRPTPSALYLFQPLASLGNTQNETYTLGAPKRRAYVMG